MHRSTRVAAGFVISILALASSCTEVARAPTAPLNHRPALLVPQLLAPLARNTPLSSDVTWSFTAGPAGAVSSNPTVGLTIVVPAGALTATETITVTALAGSHVAYRFEPHLDFANNVRLTQKLSLLHALTSLSFLGAHFEGDALQLTNGLATVTESVIASVSILAGTVSFDVRHFSGWIVASGGEGQQQGSGGSDQ
jgi:hypothetical protein